MVHYGERLIGDVAATCSSRDKFKYSSVSAEEKFSESCTCLLLKRKTPRHGVGAARMFS